MRPLLTALLLTTAASAQGATPAPLNGIWTLTGLSGSGVGAPVMGQLTISGDRIQGRSACARFEGSVQAERSAVRVNVHLIQAPGRPVCRFAVRGDLLGELNAATSYVVNRDHLILFSRAGRVAFERTGFVTPVL